MDKLSNHIKGLVQEAQELNAIKASAIEELEGRLDTCPPQWLMATKRFIKATEDNIAARQKLINELKDITILNTLQRIIDITYELEALDTDDAKAADMYDAIMGNLDKGVQ